MEETEFNTKIVVNFIHQMVTECTYWPHSLVHLLQQLVTECTNRLPAKQYCTVTSITVKSTDKTYVLRNTFFNGGSLQPAEFNTNMFVKLL